MDSVLAYFITFSCYGTWLQGDERGSVDREHNESGTPFVPANEAHLKAMRERMDQPPYSLDAARRMAVLASIEEVCTFRGWHLLAAHVRSNHAHVIVQAEGTTPERVMNDLKSYASPRLNELKCDPEGRKRWTRHGSTRYLKMTKELEEKVRYVVNGQGEPMAVYPRSGPRPSESEDVENAP
jgi:REP element-mobilizing transposase RayT